ncbi:transporter substrate-binding domain-containing protein [Mesorhizobium sp. VK24D]|uniref:Transporter substrate-binding domain-containing protein n=1 Tax=Mesorhizobium album TaxID=3072314 RepID=A0ABU4Y7D5_9HYPH|nr:transporter substrate-binding domain-containing protein [Mesorhizobium sp. VK24D]MDX8481854.1 transporter substrate-binding domain-containing protein [Mesorhizobium sp. VK24D]
MRKINILLAGMLALIMAGSSALSAKAQQSNIYADVKSRGTLRIATVAGNPPYSSVGTDGQPTGYDVDIGKALAEALGVKPEFIIVDVPGRIAALQTNRADVTIANFTATTQRSTAVAFSRPYVVVGSVFLTQDASPVKTVEDLNNAKYKVAYARGATSEQTTAAVVPNAQKLRFDANNDGILAVQSGQADSVFMDSLQAAAVVAKEPGKYRILPGNFSYEEISIGMPTGDFDWWRIVDGWVAQFNASGENNKLFKQNFGFDNPSLKGDKP